MYSEKPFWISYAVLVLLTLLLIPKLSNGIADYYCTATDSCMDPIIAGVREMLRDQAAEPRPGDSEYLTEITRDIPRLPKPLSKTELATLLNFRLDYDIYVLAISRSLTRSGLDPNRGVPSPQQAERMREQLEKDLKEDFKYFFATDLVSDALNMFYGSQNKIQFTK